MIFLWGRVDGLVGRRGPADFGRAAFGRRRFWPRGEEISAGVVIDDSGAGALAFVDENTSSEGLIFGGEEF